jgi:PAS domain S-box-containing protein
MAALTFVAFRLRAGPAMAALLFFLLVILISLWAGFLSTAFACAVAALCFVYFFTQPLYHLWMSEPVEIAATIAFSSTALIISRLLARVRERTAEVQQTNEQLQAEIAERRRAEEKLRQSEAELRRLIDAIPQHVVVVKTDGSFLYVNQVALEYTGLTLEDSLSQDSLAKIFHPDELERVVGERQEAISRGIPWNAEVRIRAKDGEYRWFMIRLNPLRDEQGHVLRWYGTRTDIEDRKQAEERVRQSEAELRQLIDAIPQQVFVFDANWNPLFANQREREYTGLTLEEVQSKDALARIFHPDDLKNLEVLRERMRSEGVPSEMEARIRGKDGQYRWFLIRDNPLRDEQGRVLRWYGTRTDIEERKRAEEALRQSETKLRREQSILTEAEKLTHTGAWEWDVVSGAWSFSDEWLRIHGTDRKTLTPEELIVIAHPDDRPSILQAFEEVRKGESPYNIEHRIIQQDTGKVRVVRATGRFVRDEEGKVAKVYGCAQDVTEQKQAEEALRRLNRELRALSECNQTLLRATDESALLQKICRIVCEEAGYRVAWVGYAEHDEAKSVRPVAWTGTEEGDVANLGITWADTERGRGIIGTAIRSGKTRCIKDYAMDPEVAPWRESALQHGFRSAIALPLKDEHANAFGSLNIYSAQPNAFTSEETRLLEELAGDLAFGIITLRSRAARERAEQEVALLSFAVDRVCEAGFLIDATGHFQYVNEEACHLLGYTRAELLGMGVSGIDPQFPAERWSDHWRDLQAQRSLSFESRHLTRDGHTFPVEVSANYFEYGGRAYNLALVRDITERKRAEEALRRSEAYLASAQKLTRTGTYAMNGTSRELIYWSEEILRLFGTDRKEGLLTRDQRWERIHPEDHDKVKEASDRVFLEKVDSEVEYRIILSDGTVKFVHTQAHPVLSASGEVAEVVATMVDITERKRAEEALRAQAALLDLTHDTVFVTDMEGVIKYWNRGAEERYGWTAEHALGRVVHDLLKTVFPGPLEEIRTELSRTGHWEGEILHTKKDGTQVVVASRWALQRDERGAPLAILETNNDITLRKRAEEALRLSNAYNRSLIEASVDPLVTIGPDGEITDVNAATEAATGRSRGELIGTDFCDYFTDPAKARAGYEQVFREGMVRDYPLELRQRDGGVMSVVYNASVYRDESGQVTGVFAAARDITERQRAQEALRRSEAYLAEGQRLSHTGSWAFELATNKYIYVSEEIFRIFEMDAQEGLPNREAISRLIHPEDWDRVNEDFEKSLREKVDASSEFRIVLPSGTVKHLQATRHPVLNDAGDVVELVGTVIDMTERKRAEQERERLRQLESELAHINRVGMMGELAASIAHEVNQPLSGVVVNGNACLRWLAGDSPNLEEAREAVRRIVRDGKRAGDVIARIRALATKTATAKERLDLNEAVGEVVAFAGDQLRKNRVAVRTELAADLLPVSGDRVQLQQVILNLVMNGAEAMSSVEERPRELIVRTQNDDAGQVRVTVQDSGKGLDPQNMERIFDAFYTTKHGGMGMGLAISRSIIQNHGGKLWAVANEGPGISVQFTIPKYQ